MLIIIVAPQTDNGVSSIYPYLSSHGYHDHSFNTLGFNNNTEGSYPTNMFHGKCLQLTELFDNENAFKSN